MWLWEGDQTGRLPMRIANALIKSASACAPLRMINTQSESVVVFKGTKVGVVEETEGPPSTESVVEPSMGESVLEDGRGWW